MQDAGSFLYLSRAQVAAAMPPPREFEAAVEAVFAALPAGSALNARHSRMETRSGTYFQAMPARVDSAGMAGMKWVCVASNADNGRPDLPHINGMIILNDLDTAVVQAVMDGDLITASRPAMVSLVGARRLARADSSRIGFVACGVQARAHFDAMAEVFPLRQATCYSRNLKNSQAFAAELRERGIDARAVTDPRLAVEDQDIVVTSVPISRPLDPFLHPDWASPGTCVISTELARSWVTERLDEMDLVVTDNKAASASRIKWQGQFEADLSDLVTGAHPGRRNATDRTFFIHPGLGVLDVAVAALVLQRARALGLGTTLAR